MSGTSKQGQLGTCKHDPQREHAQRDECVDWKPSAPAATPDAMSPEMKAHRRHAFAPDEVALIEKEHMKTVTNHKFIAPQCHANGCQYLVLAESAPAEPSAGISPAEFFTMRCRMSTGRDWLGRLGTREFAELCEDAKAYAKYLMKEQNCGK